MTLARARWLALLFSMTAAASMLTMACSSSEDETATATGEATASASPTEAASETPSATETASPTVTTEPSNEEPLLVAAATVPADFEGQLDQWVTAAGPAADAIPDQWDERAVVPGYLDYFRVPCAGVGSPAVQDGLASFPGDEGSRACFDEAVAGESPEAIAFLHRHGQFLAGFEEVGVVDLGTVGAAWVNMGRGEPAFLNGAASMVPVTWLLFGDNQRPYEEWLAQPAYADAIAGHDPIPWAEYTTIEPGATAAEGGQTFIVSIPLRDCRACADLATIRAEYRFDAAGALFEVALLPPGPGTL